MMRCNHPDARSEAAKLVSGELATVCVECGPCGEVVRLTTEDGMVWLHASAGSEILSRERAIS